MWFLDFLYMTLPFIYAGIPSPFEKLDSGQTLVQIHNRRGAQVVKDKDPHVN